MHPGLTAISATIGAFGTILSAVVVAIVNHTRRQVNGRMTALLVEVEQLHELVGKLRAQLTAARDV